MSNLVDDYIYSVGGGVHLNESAKDAVVREVMEETGVYYEIERLTVIHENFFIGTSSKKSQTCHEVAFYFLMKPRGSMDVSCNSVSMYGAKEELIWIPIKDLDKYDIYPRFLKEYLEDIPTGIIHIVTDETKEK